MILLFPHGVDNFSVHVLSSPEIRCWLATTLSATPAQMHERMPKIFLSSGEMKETEGRKQGISLKSVPKKTG